MVKQLEMYQIRQIDNLRDVKYMKPSRNLHKTTDQGNKSPKVINHQCKFSIGLITKKYQAMNALSMGATNSKFLSIFKQRYMYSHVLLKQTIICFGMLAIDMRVMEIIKHELVDTFYR